MIPSRPNHLELTFLGTGTSNGIPIIGCHCPVCSSSDPRDRRSRTSAFVRDSRNRRVYLIDTATELRTQALATGLDYIDAVLMTHAHADHTGGFDDLRRFNELAQAHLPVYTNTATAVMLRERYAYAFKDAFPFYGGKPDLILHEVDGPFDLWGRTIIPVPIRHGRLPILGFRLGPLGYVTDAKVIEPASLDLLRGVDTLVLNALRDRPHPTHLAISEALEIVTELQPRQTYLIHLSHEAGSHAELTDRLPAGVAIATDGLTIRIVDDTLP